MNIALWAAQSLLALAFLAAGSMKATRPLDKLNESMTWTRALPSALVRLIGTLEILGAIGLILPAITGVLPWLTPVAAAGLVLTMIGAMILHSSRREWSSIGMNVILLVLALFVILGRFMLVPIA